MSGTDDKNIEAAKQLAAVYKTSGEAMAALTGNDEVAIEQAFGEDFHDVYDRGVSHLTTRDGRQFSRMLIFVDLLRQEIKPTAAHKRVLGMNGAELDAYFADEPAEFDPDNPVTESGKGSSEPDAAPTT